MLYQMSEVQYIVKICIHETRLACGSQHSLPTANIFAQAHRMHAYKRSGAQFRPNRAGRSKHAKRLLMIIRQ
jgi:hypothetical protein